MIKKYNQYIKENNIIYDQNEIDPYGEEIWDDDDLAPILKIAKRKGRPYDRITYLDCHDIGLTSLEGIENLVNLHILNCWHNNLTNLNGIENLIDLKSLDCSYNDLTSLKEIENLINLEDLYCFNNNLTSLEGLENLTNLKDLWCSNNNFSNEYKQHLIEYCKNKKIDLSI